MVQGASAQASDRAQAASVAGQSLAIFLIHIPSISAQTSEQHAKCPKRVGTYFRRCLLKASATPGGTCQEDNLFINAKQALRHPAIQTIIAEAFWQRLMQAGDSFL